MPEPVSPRIPEPARRTRIFTLRLTERELATWQNASEHFGIPLAEFVRDSVRRVLRAERFDGPDEPEDPDEAS